MQRERFLTAKRQDEALPMGKNREKRSSHEDGKAALAEVSMLPLQRRASTADVYWAHESSKEGFWGGQPGEARRVAQRPA